MSKGRVNYAKGELRQLRYMKREVKRIDNEIIKVMTQLEDVKSSSAVHDDGGGKSNPYKRAELYDYLEVLEIEKSVFENRIDKVECFLKEIDPGDAIALKRVYVNNSKSLEDYAIQNGFAKNTLIRYIDRILDEF